MQVDQLPPSNIDAEHALLGSILIDPDILIDQDSSGRGIGEIVLPDHLYLETSRWLYKHLLEMHHERTPIDLITVTERLRQRNQLEEIGGEAYVIGLINVVPTSINAFHYARIVRETGIRRQLIYKATEIATLAYDEATSIDEITDQAQAMLLGVNDNGGRGGMRDARDLAMEYLELFDESGEKRIIKTGFDEIDKRAISMETGMGKTTFALSLAQNLLDQKLQVAMFTLEMPAYQLVERFVSVMTGIPTFVLRQHRLGEKSLPDSSLKLVFEATGRFSQMGIHMDEVPRCTPTSIRSKLLRAQHDHPFDVVFIDFLQLMSASEKQDNRNLEIGAITRELKILAHEMGVSIVLLSQTSRDVEKRQDKRPMLSDLRDSGEIEQNADVVWGLYRDDYYFPDSTVKPGIVEIAALKDRLSGMSSEPLDLYHDKKHGRIINVRDKESAQKDRIAF